MKLLAGVVALCIGALFACSPPARSAPDCAPRTAWAGVESASQHNGSLLAQIPVQQPISVQQITLSAGFTLRPAVAGNSFSEALFLVGLAHGPIAGLLPAFPADPAFSPLQVSTTGAGFNDNPSLGGGVLLAKILKSSAGSANGDYQQAFSPGISAGPGDVLWVSISTVSPTADPEAQLVVRYVPGGC